MIDPLLREAQQLLQARRLDAAQAAAQRAAMLAPADARTHYLLAAIARERNDNAAGLASVTRALALAPGEAAYFLLQAQLLDDAKRSEEAIASLRQALSLRPTFAEALHHLGILLAERRELEGALGAFEQALRARPQYPRALNNMGNVLRDLGRLADAERAHRQAANLQPDYGLAWHNLGLALRDLGRGEEAIAALRRAMALEPRRRETALALGHMLRRDALHDEAATVFAAGLRHLPDDLHLQLAAAHNLAESAAVPEARRAYQGIAERHPESLRAALGEALTLAPIYRDRAEILAAREAFAAGLERLHGASERFARASREDLLAALQWSNFYLAYHGEDDRPLQERYASFVRGMVERIAPQWLQAPDPLPGSARRLRIGFASSFFSDSTIGHYFQRWISALDPHQFEVHLYHLRHGLNPVVETLGKRASVLRVLAGRPISEVVEAIRRDQLDILLYPELGMDSSCFFLAALRLARVQCAAWGHPVTSGHATIDYYFSSAEMEPPEAEMHYTERLVRLPGIGTSYPRPALPAPVARSRLGLPEEGELILLPQSLFKIHPDNDRLVAEILAKRPQAKLVLFNGRHASITQRFLQRLARTFEAHAVDAPARVLVLPYVTREDYLRINQACELMLDTLHWSGGNTSLDAIASGLPIVTLPGRFMRGRQSAAMLRLADASECVASDEAEFRQIALQLLEDGAARERLRRRLRDEQNPVFEDGRPLASLSAFLQRACGAGN